MELTAEHLNLITNAKNGDRAAMDSLVQLINDDLYTYIFRLTLDRDLSQDILQDTFLEMLKNLWRLKKNKSFWPWLMRTALGKVQHHYRQKQKERKITMSAAVKNIMDRNQQNNLDQLTNLQRKELCDIILVAMQKLHLNYRTVLTLRCLEQLNYAQIASVMDCSELQSRVMFYRAKKSLKRRLARRGFHRRNMLLTAVSLFGLSTAAQTASAGCTVTASSFKVGITAAVVGFFTSLAGLITTSFITVVATYFTVKNITIICAVMVGLMVIMIISALTTLDS